MSNQGSKMRRRIEGLLLAAGLVLALVYLCARLHSVVMSRAGLWSFGELSERASATKSEEEPRTAAAVDFGMWSEARVKAYQEALATKVGTPLAILSVPKLGLEVPVFDATDNVTLNRGAGRIAGTAKPGEMGNLGIAAHRDGFFRGLKDVHVGDQIVLTTPHRRFLYIVDQIEIVKPRDVTVLENRAQPSLTLVTCYPFYFIGNAPQRYIVKASLADSEQRTLSEMQSRFQTSEKEKTPWTQANIGSGLD